MDLSQLRREYETRPLTRADVAPDPIVQLERWLAEWIDVAPNEPTAMVLATADPSGLPSARTVLLRQLDSGGLTFYTSYESRKGQELTANPQAAALFSWVPLLRQVHVTGTVHRIPDAESDDYWRTRPRGSQIAAWASEQSMVIADRASLEARYAEMAARFGDDEIPRPPDWGGLRLVPETVELWQGRSNRLHDRLRYQRPPDQPDRWEIVRLNP